jgi:hypothetical protein
MRNYVGSAGESDTSINAALAHTQKARQWDIKYSF